MHLRPTTWTAALAAALSAVLITGMAQTASAAAGTTCADFTFQEDAQAALLADPGDPNGLDGDHDGTACESLPHRPASAVTTTDPLTSTTTPPAASTAAAAATTTSAAPTTTTAPVTSTTTAATGTTTTTVATTAARTDRNCADFATQAEAQAVLTADPTDPNRLDADHDGVACEDNFGTQSQQVAVFPNGAVHTGGSPLR